MIKEAIIKLTSKEDLTFEEAKTVMDEIMSGEATDVQKTAYLVALAMKGETIDEISGSAVSMRDHAIQVEHDEDVLEIVGTGGDKSNSFNISSTASLIISAAGIPVAKHGNRAASSKSGAADVLEALGVNITIEPEKMTKVLKDDKITLTCTNQNNASLWNYKNYRRRINTGFVHKLSFLNGIKGAFDPILNMITNLNDISSLINFNMHFESIYESSIESIEVKLIANYEGVNYTVNTCNYINNTIDVFYEKEFYVNFMNSTITELNE